MREEQIFAKTLEELSALAKEQGNMLSEEQVTEAFDKAKLNLGEPQLEMIFAYLKNKKIGIGQPADPFDYMTQEEIDYLNKHGFSADFTKLKYSYNVGLWGTSICGGEILDSAQGLPETAYLKHVEKEGSEQLRLTFEKGELKAVNDETFDDPIKAIQKVEEIGAAYGIGRDMHVGDTIIGIKGRVGFEAAAPMLIIGAHRFLEKYTLSKWQQYWKDQVANWYGMFLHESQYLEPVMRDIEAMLQESQRNVNGTAILELRPLSFSTVGVESEDDLVKTKFGEYGEMQKGWTAEDAKGFIKVTSTPLRVYYNNHKDEEI